MRNILIIAMLGMIVLASVLMIRTSLLTSKQVQAPPLRPFRLSKERVTDHLARAIQLKTISQQDSAQFDGKEFLELHSYLTQTFPKVHAALTKEVVGDLSLLYTWVGTDPSLKPILLLAHMDVVPVEPGTEGDWTHPPFTGRIAGGYIWGRGSMDDKVSVLGILEAVEFLLAEGFQPRRTVYLAFGHDEEVGGKQGASKNAALLKSRGVELAYTLDEGLGITDGILPRISEPVALIGIAEKGYLTLALKVEAGSAGVGCGHSSMPPPQTNIGILSSAIRKIESNPMPTRMTRPVRQMFDYIGPNMDAPGRVVVANLWLFEPVVEMMLARKPSTNALIRTTTAVTMIKGGTKENVLPCEAEAVVNLRLLPGDTIEGITQRVQALVGDSRISVEKLHGAEPSPVSETDSFGFQALEKTIRQIFPNVAVAPTLTIGGTDSKHYVTVSDTSYRFLPLWLRREDLPRYHGTNERIAVDNYIEIIQFYTQFIRNSDALDKR